MSEVLAVELPEEGQSGENVHERQGQAADVVAAQSSQSPRDGEAVIHSKPPVAYRILKRSFDFIAAIAGLVVLSPLLTGAAIAVKATSPGPVIFKQQRFGKDKVPFMCYKFRTMKVDTPSDIPTRIMKENSSVMTPIGATLRKTSLASVIIGTPGAGEPTNSLSSAAKTSLDQQFYDWRPEVVSCDAVHYTSPEFLSFAFFGGSRKAQIASTARVSDIYQNESRWHGGAFHSMNKNGACGPTSALGVAA